MKSPSPTGTGKTGQQQADPASSAAEANTRKGKADDGKKKVEIRKSLSRQAHQCPNPYRPGPASTTPCKTSSNLRRPYATHSVVLHSHREPPSPHRRCRPRPGRCYRRGRRWPAPPLLAMAGALQPLKLLPPGAAALSAWIRPREHRIQQSENQNHEPDGVTAKRAAHRLSQPHTDLASGTPDPPSWATIAGTTIAGDLTCQGRKETPTPPSFARAGVLMEHSGGGEVEERRGRDTGVRQRGVGFHPCRSLG